MKYYHIISLTCILLVGVLVIIGCKEDEELNLVSYPDNFANIALIPGGVRVYFQPYQVAPWSAGTQIVDIPLEKLKDARPLMDLWGRQ